LPSSGLKALRLDVSSALLVTPQALVGAFLECRCCPFPASPAGPSRRELFLMGKLDHPDAVSYAIPCGLVALRTPISEYLLH